MDPLSITATVVALAQAAAAIAKAISRLRAFGEVPARVYALKNEVTDLEVVLRQVGFALEDQPPVEADIDPGWLKPILSRTQIHLANLAEALERVARAVEGGKIKVISRTAIWWKEKDLFQRIQGEIHQIKATLTVLLSTSNSQDLHRVIVELRRVSVLASSPRQPGQQGDPEAITRALDSHHTALAASMDQQYQGLSDRLDALWQLIPGGGPPPHIPSPDEIPEPSEKETTEASSIETLRVLISHRVPCRNWCPCACHVQRKLNVRVPGLMEALLGKMFIGYTAMPAWNSPCDFRGCRDRQTSYVTMEYWFPWWFLMVNLRLQLKYMPNAGPQMQLSSIRRVPDTAQSISFAMNGDIEGLRHLFSQGMASPRDVSDSRGYSLVRWALYGGMHQYEAVKFLISQGALVDEISYDNVWDFTFRGKCNEREMLELRCITERGEVDWVEEQNFPLVHRIIFGMSPKSLAAELEENQSAVYLEDAQGRTALDWAAARAQLDDIRLLLSHGADPNGMDISGRTTVLHAVDSHSTPCLRLILEGGGNPNPTMPKGIFRSSPLTATGFGGMPDMLELLLVFGADPNAYNPEGLTALHAVARTQNVDCALTLLNFGADMNAVSTSGRTPLTTAVIHNNHVVLRLFLDCYYDNTAVEGSPLLPIVAEHADVKTMSILASSLPLKRSYDLSRDSLVASRNVLQQRRDHDEKLAAAFEELVAAAQFEKETSMTASTSSLVESGLFYSAKSSFHSDLADAIAGLRFSTVSPGCSEGSTDGGSDKCVDSEQGPVEGVTSFATSAS